MRECISLELGIDNNIFKKSSSPVHQLGVAERKAEGLGAEAPPQST